MKEIKLTKGLFTQVDDDDYGWLNQYRWYAHKVKGEFYAATRMKGIFIYMHRFIMNTPNKLDTDHWDHKKLNNQRYNLRICTTSQNLMNIIPRGSSKYLGVSIYHGYIRTEISKLGERYYLGSFKTEIAAAMAYDKKAKELFGEFANLNFK